jgi:hypothetical protein
MTLAMAVAPLYPEGMFESTETFGAVSLQELARHMRDGRWLDVRTDEGPIYRVRIVEMVVRVQSEDIVFRQEYLDGSGKFAVQQFPVESDAIWKTMTTKVRIEDVQPYGITVVAPEDGEDGGGHVVPITDGQQQRLLETVLKGALYLNNLTLGELRHNPERQHLVPRYVAMLVLYEMSNLAHGQITEALGYASITPLLEAMKERSRDKSPLPDGVRRLGDLVDNQLAPVRYRSAKLSPSYKPVLPR